MKKLNFNKPTCNFHRKEMPIEECDKDRKDIDNFTVRFQNSNTLTDSV